MSSPAGSRLSAILLPVVPSLCMGVFWILCLAEGESVGVAATYRYGDTNYFPLIAGLAHFDLGEWSVFERLGEGIVSFPVPSLAIHGLAIGLVGEWGFVLADLLVPALVFLSARRLFRAAELSPRTADALALVVSCGLLAWPGGHLQRWAGWAPDLHLWGFRLPRPFVTDLFMLLSVGGLLRIVVQGREGLREWIWLGLWFGLLLQSRYYSAATVGLAIAVGSLVVLLRGPDRRRVSIGLVGFTATAALAALPFLAQLAFGEPDVRVRLGAFPVDRLRPLLLDGQLADVLVPVAVASLAAGLVYWSGLPRLRERSFALLGLAVVCVLAGLALPASTILLGETIQPYQFGQELVAFETLCLLVSLAQLLEAAGHRLGRFPGAARLRARGGPVLLLAIAALCLVLAPSLHGPAIERGTHMRLNFPRYRAGPGYREAFRELAAELTSPAHADLKVAAAFDIHVLDWWSLFGGGHTFTPDTCSTNIADDEIEDRLLRFFRILGVSERNVGRLVSSRSVLVFNLGCAKYQASSAHHLAPLYDYPVAHREQIRGSPPLRSWQVVLPDSERARLVRRYRRTAPDAGDMRLDLIVLTRSRFEDSYVPAPDRFRRTFENEHFRVYRDRTR